jgi:hypothetical protein
LLHFIREILENPKSHGDTISHRPRNKLTQLTAIN